MTIRRHLKNLSAIAGRFHGLRYAVNDLLLMYSHRLPARYQARRLDLRFKFEVPVGEISLCLRVKDGADSFIFSEVFVHHYYEMPLRRPPLTVLDLGANAGLTAVYFSRLYPDAKIACVEPIDDNVQQLRINIELNNVGAVVFEAAVHSDDGVIPIGRDAKSYAHKVVANNSDVGNADRVPAISIPSLIERLGWDRVGLMKVDIEGHEEVVFSGDCPWAMLVDAIVIEIHSEAFYDQLKSFADRFGFSIEKQAGLFLLERL